MHYNNGKKVSITKSTYTNNVTFYFVEGVGKMEHGNL